MKASKLFRKYPKAPDFDHSNYRLFERISAVPGTSNNRGLTVVSPSYHIFITRHIACEACRETFGLKGCVDKSTADTTTYIQSLLLFLGNLKNGPIRKSQL